MIRIEVIGNRSIEEDFFELLGEKGVGMHYTLFPVAQGNGYSGTRRGDHIFPEENFVFFSWVEDEDRGRVIKDIVEELRTRFPDEGIAFFVSACVDL